MSTLRALCDGEYAAEAESAAMRIEADGPALTALYDALGFTRDALGAALGLSGGFPSSLLLEASVAAAEAFPLRSAESQAFGVILGAVGTMVSGAAA